MVYDASDFRSGGQKISGLRLGWSLHYCFFFLDDKLYSTLSLFTQGPVSRKSGNLSGPISVFGDKCFLEEVNFVSFEY